MTLNAEFFNAFILFGYVKRGINVAPAYGLIIRLLILSMPLLLCGCGFFWSDTGSAEFVKGRNVVETACGQIGKKYRAGCASPQKGFDCSGLVWWSYKQHGVSVPRITVDQAKTGKKVAACNLKAGDIVVFKVSRSPRGFHTGLYTGNGKFVHSPSSGKNVCMEELYGKYWKDKLVAIRRVGG